MVQPTSAKPGEEKIYSDILYYAKRVPPSRHQLVYKKLLPDGESLELSPCPSQKLQLHSPDGFQWGSGGSGPAQLSLALLLDATDDPGTALAYHRDFKWAHVAYWDDEWSITREAILGWLKAEQRLRLVRNFGKSQEEGKSQPPHSKL